ncbi:MAG: thiamine phosphate synthase [Tissierellia bacterium]|nr:thiamine phosphate synthase [Tissierellia bacterium]
MTLKDKLALYAVTDRSHLKIPLEEAVEQALLGGATILQLREKDLDFESFEKEANRIKRLCKKFEIPFIINDNVEIAKKVGADGVHVGQEDMACRTARDILGQDAIIGVSASSLEEAIQGEKDGADYLGVGAVFPTGSKEDASHVSIETLQEICQAVSIPVIAIGGISKDNIQILKKSGIVGIAVISAIFSQEDIRKATRQLKQRVKEWIL